MNLKKKRVMSLALASAVLLSQSSLVAFAEEPAAGGDVNRAADSSQKKTTELLSFTAKSDKPITVSNGFSAVLSDTSHYGVKDGDVITESIVIKNPTKRDVTYYIEAEGYNGSLDWGGGDFTVELETANSVKNAVTVKAGENQVITAKVTVKNSKETNSVTFNVYEVPAGDVTTGGEVNAAVRIDSATQYYYAEDKSERKIKISADFTIETDSRVALIKNQGTSILSVGDSGVVEFSESDIDEAVAFLLISGNTYAMITDINPNLTELKFSNKDNVTVTYTSGADIASAGIIGVGGDWGYAGVRGNLKAADGKFKVSLPKNVEFGLAALREDKAHNWEVMKYVYGGYSADAEVKFEFADFAVDKTVSIDTSAFNNVEYAVISTAFRIGDKTDTDHVVAYAADGKLQIPKVTDADELDDIEIVFDNGKSATYLGVASLKDGDTLDLSNVYTGKFTEVWSGHWSTPFSAGAQMSGTFKDITDAFGNELSQFSPNGELKSVVTLTNTKTGDKYTSNINWLYAIAPGVWRSFDLPADIPDGEYDIEIVVSGVKENLAWYELSTETEGSGAVINNSSYSGTIPVGQNLSLSASAKPGSEFKYWEVSGITLTDEQITNPNLSFVMPNNNVTVKAVFDIVVNTTTSAEAPYLITIGDSADGRISVSVNDKKGEATAAEGDKVKLEAIPRSGFTFSKWKVEGVELTDEALAKSVLEFTMPANDVSVSAEFSAAKYSVKVTTDGHGTAAASPEAASAGDTVTLTATPASGYKFSKWTVVKGDVTIKDNKFTMPESDVEIKAEFTRTSSGTSGSSGGSTRRPSSSSSAAETVTVNGKTGGWSDVTSAINSAANGATITISGSTDIPADVIAAAAKKNVKLEVKVNDTFTWVIDAAKVGEGSKYLSISDSIITATNKTIRSNETTKDFRITESKLGTGASVRYNAGKANSGKFANLFRVDGSKLVFVGVVKVDAAGNALLPITAAGAYKIVISDETKLVGDLNNSMGLNALDAALMLKKLVDGTVSADEAAKFDFNGDGKTNALDAAAILKWIVNN